CKPKCPNRIEKPLTAIPTRPAPQATIRLEVNIELINVSTSRSLIVLNTWLISLIIRLVFEFMELIIFYVKDR
ncbi:MAG: hypothetical protein ACK46Z_03800, partial [Bacteroidota bacterium]